MSAIRVPRPPAVGRVQALTDRGWTSRVRTTVPSALMSMADAWLGGNPDRLTPGVPRQSLGRRTAGQPRATAGTAHDGDRIGRLDGHPIARRVDAHLAGARDLVDQHRADRILQAGGWVEQDSVLPQDGELAAVG
jgi:hypothetical protein